MTDEPAPGTALATTPRRAPRQVIPVEDVVAIFDTARFEHYQRIASVMAHASLIPEALRGATYESTVGNCFLVTSLADRLGMDPFGLAQCCSVVYGRLMIEGKAVQAALEKKLKIELQLYYTGKVGTTERRVYVSDRKLTEAEEKALAPGEYPRGCRMVDGSVAEWQTYEKDKRTPSGAWRGQGDMQLRYRGTRTWSRAFAPGLMLGVYTEDEFDEIVERRDQGAAGKPEPRLLTAGFPDSEAPFVAPTPAASPPPPPPAAQDGAGEAGKAQGGTPAADEGGKPAPDASQAQGDPKPVETVAEFEDEGADAGPATQADGETARPSRQDQLMAMFDLGREAHAEGLAPDAPADLDDEEAQQWRDGWDSKAAEVLEPAQAQGGLALTAPAEESGVAGMDFAEPGKPYMLSNDDFSTYGTRPVYVDGESKATGGANSGVAVFDRHPPKAGQAPASPPPPPPPPASPPPPPATKAKSPPPPPAEPSLATQSGGDPFAAAEESILSATSWETVKMAIRALAVTAAWKGAEDEAKRMLRATAWDKYTDMRQEGVDATDPVSDFSLFRLWLEFGAKSQDEIDGLWRVFFRQDAYTGASEADKKAMSALVVNRKAELPKEAS